MSYVVLRAYEPAQGFGREPAGPSRKPGVTRCRGRDGDGLATDGKGG